MKIYILVAKGARSGGPELVHQFCYTVNQLGLGVKAEVCYVDVEETVEEKSFPVDVPAEACYEKYETTHVTSLAEMDQPENVVIFPEGFTPSIPVIKKAKKVLWWMSVDNYLESTQEINLPVIRKEIDLHLYQSVYAKKYVEEKIPGAKLLPLSDYINQAHGQFLYPAELRKNQVLYNPKKGYQIIEKLQKELDWITWVPIINKTLEEIIILQQASKVYVDFGNHPGKDRIPREAAANGCCILTNREGSAAFYEDVPIPDTYKFENPLQEIPKIEEKIKDIFENFQTCQEEFASYRQWIQGEPERFRKETLAFIEEVKKL